MSDKGKERAEGVVEGVSGATGTDREDMAGDDAGDGRSWDEAQLASEGSPSLHRSPCPTSPAEPGLMSPPLPPPSRPMASLPLPDSLVPLLHCPLCRPSRLIRSPYTLRCGHTVCADHIQPGPAHTPPCPLNLPACAAAFAGSVQNTYVHPDSGVVIGIVPAPVQSHPTGAHPTVSPASLPPPSPLRVDVTTSKILHLISRAQASSSADPLPVRIRTYDEDADERTDSEGEDEGDNTPDAHSRQHDSDDNLYADPDPSPSVPPVPPSSPHSPSRSRSHSPPREPPSKRRRRRTPRPPHIYTTRNPNIPNPSTGDAPSSSPTDPESRFEKELLSELTCEICFALMWKPITTPCQHTFCSKCLQRALDHNPACPLCRESLPAYGYFDDQPCNKVLLSILLKAFPETYAERGLLIEEEERNARLDTPIFVCQLSFPGMPTVLHFFEPRYRLMLRRCLATPNPCFGMIPPPRTAPSPQGSASMSTGNDYGTMLAIRNVMFFADGRSIVETWGTWRFRVMERGTMDGYLIGRVERVEDWDGDEEWVAGRAAEDNSIAASVPREGVEGLRRRGVPAAGAVGSSSSATLERTNAELVRICHDFLEQLREVPWVVRRINEAVVPAPADPALFSYWMALILPIDEHEKAKLLPIRSPRLRLRLVVHWIEQFNSQCAHAHALRQVVRKWVHRLLTPLALVVLLNVLLVVWWACGRALEQDREELVRLWLQSL